MNVIYLLGIGKYDLIVPSIWTHVSWPPLLWCPKFTWQFRHLLVKILLSTYRLPVMCLAVQKNQNESCKIYCLECFLTKNEDYNDIFHCWIYFVWQEFRNWELDPLTQEKYPQILIATSTCEMSTYASEDHGCV